VRVKNYRPYLIAGAGFSFDLGREREKAILLQQMDGFFDFGVGCTIYFQYFRFSPELKFALGLTDILTPLDQRGQDYVSDYNKRFTNAISRLTSRLFTLTFNFE
jgi:porT protein